MRRRQTVRRLMNRFNWSALKKIRAVLTANMLDTDQQLVRIRSVERNIGLPVRAGVIVVLIYYLFFSRWFTGATTVPEIVLEAIRRLLLGYIPLSLTASVLLFYI